MSLLERTVITRYEAITDPWEKALEKVRGKTEESRRGFVDWAKSVNESLNAGIHKLGELNQAFEGAAKIIDFAKDALHEYGESVRLEAAAGATNVERLSDAFEGLVSRHDVLKFAAQAQHGAMKLTQEQMEKVAKATVGLTRAGFDQEEAFKKLTEAAIKAKAEGLDDFGISVKQGADATETLNNIMAAFDKKIAETSTLTASAADDVDRLAVSWQNAKSALMEYAGASLSLGAAKEGRGLLFDVANVGTLGFADYGLSERKNREAYESTKLLGTAAASGPESSFSSTSHVELDKRVTDAIAQEAMQMFADSVLSGIAKGGRARSGGGGSSKKDDQLDTSNFYGKQNAYYNDQILNDWLGPAPEGAGQSLLGALGSVTGGTLDALKGGELTGGIEQTTKAVEDMVKAAQPEGPPLLERLGLHDLDGWELAGSVVQGFADTYVDAMTEVALTSGKAGETFKKGLGVMVAGVGQKLLAYGAAELVEAGADAFTLNFAGAAMHAGAAGLYTAGGLAAIATAKSAFGYGAAASSPPAQSKGASGAGSGGGGSSGGSTTTQPTQQQTIIVYGDSFADDSPRMRQLRAEEMLRRARGGTGGKDD